MSITVKELQDLIESTVKTTVEPILAEAKLENETLKKEIEDLKTKAVTPAVKENDMPFYQDYQKADKGELDNITKGFDHVSSIGMNFSAEKHTDAWFRDATPTGRMQAFMKGLKEGNTELIIKSHAFGKILGKDLKPVREYDRNERLGIARLVDKDLGSTNGSPLIPADYRQELIDCIYHDTSGLPGQWTKWITSTGGETYTPVLEAGVDVHWIGEAELKPESDPTIGTMEWKPKKQVTRTNVTEELLEDSSPSAEQMIRDIQKNAMILDDIQQFFYGDGVANPRGIHLDIPAANRMFVGAVFNSADLKDLKCLVRQDFRPGGWFYAHDCIWCQIEKFTNLLGYEWQQSMNDMLKEGVPGTVLGFNYYRGEDETMPMGSAETGTGTGAFGHMFFGNPKNYIAVIRTDLRMKFIPNAEYKYNVSSFITEKRWDAQMRCNSFSELMGLSCSD